MTKAPLISMKEAAKEMRHLKSIWSNESLLNTRMLFRACVTLEEIAASLKEAAKRKIPRRKNQSPYNKFFSVGMKAGKTPAQIGQEWKAGKK